jgi:outer membrane protein OmpA-like peptidoglycan-associated protein
VAGGSGTALSTLTYVDAVTSLTYTLVLRFDYTAGDPFVTQTATLTVPAGSATACSGAPCDVKLYQAMDTYLGGSDRGAGFRTLDASSNTILVGVRSTSGTTEGLRWRSGDQWTGYVSTVASCPFRSSGCTATPSDGTGSLGAGGNFWTGMTAIDTRSTVDNAMGVMWDTADAPGTTTYSWDVLFAVAPVVSTASLSATATCAVYSQTLAATSGSGTYIDWQVATGSLPAGLTLNSATGIISGTSSVVATSAFTVTVTDSNYFTSEPQALSIAVSQGMPVVSTASLAGGVVGTAYSQTLAASCGTEIYSSWALTSGTLPAGLSLNTATGVISGTPTTVQVAPITVEVTDSGGNVATKSLSITVTAVSVPAAAAPAPAPAPTPAVPCTLTTQSAITNPVNGNVPVPGMGAGATVMLNGCVAVPTTLTPDGRSLTVSASGFMMRLEGRGDANDPLGLAGNSILQLVSGPAGTSEIRSRALVSGTGAMPGTTVKVYLLSSTYLGEVPVDAAGTFNGSVDIPPGLAPGTYTLQANALGTSGQTRSLSIGVLMKSSKSVTIPSGRATVRFAKDSAKLTVRAKRELRALAQRIGPSRAHSIVIGYVQRDGTKRDNKELSTARARKAASFLRSIGMRGVVVAKGRGVDAQKPGPRGRRVDVSIVGLPR